MLNILLVNTGGTIGSIQTDNTINTSDQQPYRLLQLFKENYLAHQQVSFTAIHPIQLLSENVVPVVWQKLINAIEAEDINQFDGVIVTHGTDTLAFSAAALSLYFNTINIPLLLVSSNYPLDHPQANGLNNFICAIEYIKQQQPAGVFVPYQNPGQPMLVHLGSRLASSLQLSGDFISIQFNAPLCYEHGRFITRHNYLTEQCRPIQLAANFSARILLIKPYPGLDYRYFNLDQFDLVLHDLYHSGTACSTVQWGENHSLMQFIKHCQFSEKDFYMAPAIKTPQAYQSTQELLDQGGTMVWDMSLEATYVKLLLAYGNYSDPVSISLFLEQNIAFEKISL